MSGLVSLDAAMRERRKESRNTRASQRPNGADTKSDFVTEDSAALLFRERHVGQFLYDHDAGAWYRWDGQRWAVEKTGWAFDFARALARDLSKDEGARNRATLQRVVFANGVEKFARCDRAFATRSDGWDLDPMLLGTPGGTVDLRTGVMRPAKPDDRITKVTAVTPADRADCPRWLAFLEQATKGNAELVTFLQQFWGYSLRGQTKEHTLVFIHGTGKNGKTVCLNVVMGIFGDYAKMAAMDTFIASTGDRHPTDLAMLRGARLVAASETEEGRAWAESRIKQMTGGDPIVARFMRQDFFEFRPSFKIAIIGNHKPVLHNVDEAARRRFLIIPFVHKPSVPDLDLEAKLKAEWPGILRWMIDGCLDWQRNGLSRPDSVVAATEEYFSDQDALGEWIEDHCDVEHRSQATTAALFASWTKFAKANNDPIGSVRGFSQALQKRGYTLTKKIPKESGSGTARGFRGIQPRFEPADQRRGGQ